MGLTRRLQKIYKIKTMKNDIIVKADVNHNDSESDIEEYLSELVKLNYSKEDEDYIKNLIESDFSKCLTYEQAYLFVGIIIENYKYGKSRALAAYDRLIHKWISTLEMTDMSDKNWEYFKLGAVESYLSGALVPNNIVSVEESDRISEKYVDLILKHSNLGHSDTPSGQDIEDLGDEHRTCNRIATEVDDINKTDKNAKSRNLWGIIATTTCIVFCIVLVIGISSYLRLKAENQKLEDDYALSQETVVALTDENEEYSELINADQNAAESDNIETFLKRASVTNGIVSVERKLYCVQCDDSIVIDVSWPPSAVETFSYMKSEEPEIVNAEWTSDSNIKLSGISEGVAEICLGSDENCTENSFSFVVICY